MSKKALLLTLIIFIISIGVISCKKNINDSINTIYDLDPTITKEELIAQGFIDVSQPNELAIEKVLEFQKKVNLKSPNVIELKTLDYPIIRYFAYEKNSDSIITMTYNVNKQTAYDAYIKYQKIRKSYENDQVFFEVFDRVDGNAGSIYLFKQNQNEK